MSHQEQAFVSLLSQLALSFDGAVLGLALAYAAVRTLFKFTATSAALRKLHRAPSVSVSDLRSLLAEIPSDADGNSDGGNIVIVRGTVDAKSAVEGGTWKTLRPGVLVSRESGDKSVILQRTQTCIYNEWKGLFGWTSDLRAIFARSWRQQESTSLRKVPFVLIDVGRWPNAEYVVVNMDGSRHPLPLSTVYHKLQPITASPYTFLQALFGHEYPVGLLDEEKILPLGKNITAVGLCSLKNGIAEIKSCKDLPYFLFVGSFTCLVQHWLQLCNIPIINKTGSDFCSNCCIGKSHCLPSSPFLIVYSNHFELIYTDLWGPSPVLSNTGYSYYVTFVDAHTQFTWLYLLKSKSEPKAFTSNLVMTTMRHFLL
ncbi:E3 ubiquitin-protein ligase SPL2-like isoform X3 [Glycine soja]|uniref:E3 ubiquitin-protein ligase SPL2 isoform X3 n=1 Tax=Glycine max TaxID=3847 RepID=UPI00103E78AB|nr:E3 ubiquitin-protein ligase SPL2 isoform X3 [Glycine max]XP_028224778.1 E3 ubiquitin-protein ligase SPL2-like isoform X3 [Glycine soja]